MSHPPQPSQPGFPVQQGRPEWPAEAAAVPPQGPAPAPHDYASWGARFLARVLDGLLTGTVPAVVLLTAGDRDAGWPSAAVVAGGLLWLAGRGALCWMLGATGRTPGRVALGIQVLRRSTGGPPGLGRALVRQLLAPVNLLPCLLGCLWPAWDARKQSFTDKIVGSVVLRTV
ncbi:RDD family protein [Streptomyces sp. YIM 98790]|uniref:RDD family protein n=1 Tax=Streptomyces sp. YIM 98790 TaxID=2689077 RepID=UPI00140BFB13|nr:RDD family protein [Streptomyces sp. YIM 98790]